MLLCVAIAKHVALYLFLWFFKLLALSLIRLFTFYECCLARNWSNFTSKTQVKVVRYKAIKKKGCLFVRRMSFLANKALYTLSACSQRQHYVQSKLTQHVCCFASTRGYVSKVTSMFAFTVKSLFEPNKTPRVTFGYTWQSNQHKAVNLLGNCG